MDLAVPTCFPAETKVKSGCPCDNRPEGGVSSRGEADRWMARKAARLVVGIGGQARFVLIRGRSGGEEPPPFLQAME